MPMLPPKSTLRKKRAAARAKGDGGELDLLAEGDMFDQLPDEDDADGDTAVDWEHGDAGLDAGGEVTVAQFVVAKVVRKRRYDIGLRALRERARPRDGRAAADQDAPLHRRVHQEPWAAFRRQAHRQARRGVRGWRVLKATYASPRQEVRRSVGDAGGDPDEGAVVVADDGEGGEEDGEATGPAQEDWAEVPYLWVYVAVSAACCPTSTPRSARGSAASGCSCWRFSSSHASTRPSHLGHLLWSMGLVLAPRGRARRQVLQRVPGHVGEMKLCGYAARRSSTARSSPSS